jgi:hypothetical protein
MKALLVASQRVSVSNVICCLAVKAAVLDGKWGAPRLYREPPARSSHRYI